MIRIPHLQEQLWLDELHTGWTIAGGWMDLFSRAHIGNQPPLFFFIESLFASIIGASSHPEIALRLFPLLCDICTIVLGYEMVRRWTQSSAIPFLASVTLAVHADIAFYAVEARCYSFLSFMTFVQLVLFQYAFFRTNSNRRENLWGLVAWSGITALAVETHYGFYFLLSIEILLLLVATISFHFYNRFKLRDAWIVAAFLLPVLALELPNLLFVWSKRVDWQSLDSRLENENLALGAELKFAFAILGCSLLGLLIRLFIQRQVILNMLSEAKRLPIYKISSIPSLPIFIVVTLTAILHWILASFFDANVYLPRYLVHLYAPLFCAGIPLLFYAWNKGWGRGLAIIFYATLIWHLHDPFWEYGYGRPLYRNERWRDVVTLLNSETEVKHVVLFPGLIEDWRLEKHPSPEFVSYCKFPLRSSYRLRDDLKLSPHTFHADPIFDPKMLAELRAISTHGTCVLILREDPVGRPLSKLLRQELLDQLGGKDQRTSISQEEFGNLTLLYVRQSQTPNE